MLDDFFICLGCVKDEKLKQGALNLSIIENSGIDISTNSRVKLQRPECSFCGNKDADRLSIGVQQDACINNKFGNNHFINLLKLHSLRFFSSVELLDGESACRESEKFKAGLKTKIIDSNYLLDSSRVYEPQKVDQLIDFFIKSSGGSNIDVLNIRDENSNKKLSEFTSPLLEQIKKDLRRRNFYQTSPYCRLEITRNLDHFVTTLSPKENHFFVRARINNVTDIVAYEGEKIEAAPVDRCIAGRINRANERFLYLSNNEKTAISEVRPDVGHRVSIAKFRLEKEARMIKINEISLLEGFRSQHIFDTYLFLSQLNKQFSSKITPEQKSEYKITQYAAWLIRKEGYDGIIFRSSVNDNGVNYVFFNPQSAKYIERSSEIKKIHKIKYIFN